VENLQARNTPERSAKGRPERVVNVQVKHPDVTYTARCFEDVRAQGLR
jgi:hypothetical protein